MPKMIQLRNVPDALYRQLKARAASQGVSLSDFLIQELRKITERPTDEEIRARLEALPVVELSPSPTEIVRDERDND